jgi:hypothetical protein
MFSVKNDLKKGNVLTLLLCKFALKYATRRIQANQECLK